MSVNYSTLYRTYADEVATLDSKISRKDNELYSVYKEAEREARNVRSEARNPADTTYRDAVDTASTIRAEAIAPIDKAYEEATSAALAARTQSRKESDAAYDAAVKAADTARAEGLAAFRAEVDEEKKAVLLKHLPEDVKHVDVLAWMFTSNTWYNYSSECLRVLSYLEEEKPTTLVEVNAFGRRTQGWCSTYSTLLYQAIEAGVLPVEYTNMELAQLKIDTILMDYGVNTTSRQHLTSAILTVLEASGIKDDAVTAFVESLKG